MMFMVGQWYLLGKEVDYRLKIYYRINSSMDRILYRLVLGSVIMILLFNIFSFFPEPILINLFWAYFIIVGLFYSWPTRGRIIEESFSSQFSEYKFLDSFEKNVLFLLIIMFLVSIPDLPLFHNIEALKLYFDPKELVHDQYWNFISVLYYPFHRYSRLYNLAWCLHTYFLSIGFYLLAFYGVLRFFLSRRLSILGVFTVISTWSFAKILGNNYFAATTTTFSVLWVWSMMWSTKSSTYRSGLFVGLVNYFGTIINPGYVILFPIQLLLFNFVFLRDKTKWYRRQFLKYTIFGGILMLFTVGSHLEHNLDLHGLGIDGIFTEITTLIGRKAFFTIFPLGLGLVIFHRFIPKIRYLSHFNLDYQKLDELGYSLIILFVVSTFLMSDLMSGLGMIWVLSIFSLFPLEWIFRSISRLRSKRNLIFVVYILISLLDSHFEGRLRTIGRIFLEGDLMHLIN